MKVLLDLRSHFGFFSVVIAVVRRGSRDFVSTDLTELGNIRTHSDSRYEDNRSGHEHTGS